MDEPEEWTIIEADTDDTCAVCGQPLHAWQAVGRVRGRAVHAKCDSRSQPAASWITGNTSSASTSIPSAPETARAPDARGPMLRSRGANPKSLTSTRVTEIDGRRLFLTNLDRVLWREEGLTQADLVDYYLDVADHALPFLINRPLSLLRNAEAAGTRDWIFQKTAPPGLPPWVPMRRVRTEHAGLGSAEYVVGCDRAALIHLTNLCYVSYHPWSCTVDALDRPDQLLFDLDPTAIAFREVRNAAMTPLIPSPGYP